MFMFLKKQHSDLKSGKIILTFQPWETLRVLRGKIYRAHKLGLLRVLDVDFKILIDITPDELKRCGYRSFESFLEDYEKLAERSVDFEKERAVRIEFEYIGEDIENYKKAMGNVKDSELYDLKEKLIIADQKSAKPWIIETLKLLRDSDHIPSKDLEKRLKIPAERIKQHMKKLKAMNLITSNQRKGYGITPLGVKVLKTLGSGRK
jgi:DNA-binding transcriptional ArsR family regulator